MMRWRSKFSLRCLMLVGVLGINLLLGSCVPLPTNVPPTSAPPSALSRQAILEISGIGDKGVSRALQINAPDTALALRFSASAKTALSGTFAQTPYLEYTLVYQGNQKWRLFYTAPPTGVITATSAQAHIVVSGSDGQLLLALGPVFNVAAASPISPTNASGAVVKVDEGILWINRAMGWPEGSPVFSGETAFLLLSDGKADQPRRTLVIFGSVQPNGDLDPPPPDGPFDLRAYCVSSPQPPAWCWLVY